MKPQIIRHGEVILQPISEIPKEAKLEKETNKYIVAHSETGHHHILEAQENYQIYSWNGETYIHLGNLAELTHQKTGKDVHKPHQVYPSAYKVIIKKEFNYYKGVIERVRD